MASWGPMKTKNKILKVKSEKHYFAKTIVYENRNLLSPIMKDHLFYLVPWP